GHHATFPAPTHRGRSGRLHPYRDSPQGIADRDMRGHRVLDDSLILCFNAHFEPIDFTLPPVEFGNGWRVVVATAAATATSAGALPAAATFVVDARSSVVLQAVTE
ncbi:hypothetical protein OSH93_13095, partial [Mycobacterium ulcerans]